MTLLKIFFIRYCQGAHYRKGTLRKGFRTKEKGRKKDRKERKRAKRVTKGSREGGRKEMSIAQRKSHI